MLVPNRNGSSAAYRYGFQGQEKDDEIKGEGNSLNYKYRMHDPRVGRFFAVDPLTQSYPHYTPYSFSGNKVIHAIELEGLEELIFHQDFETNRGSVFEVINSSKHLKEIINSVSLPSRAAKKKVHFVTFENIQSARPNKSSLAFTTPKLILLVNQIKKDGSIIDNMSPEEMGTIEGGKIIDRYFGFTAIVEATGLSDKQIIDDDNRGIDHFVIGTGEKTLSNSNLSDIGLKTGAKAIIHEVEAHLKNRLDGVKNKDDSDHKKYGNKKISVKTGNGKTRPGSPSEKSFDEIDDTIESGCQKCDN